jgi:hypothetical protein
MKTGPDKNARAYTINRDGMHPEVGRAYIYKDGKHLFWFYMQSPVQDARSGDWTLPISHASTQRFAGELPAIRPEDQIDIEEKVREYFSRHNIFGEKLSPLDPTRSVLFEWRFAHR